MARVRNSLTTVEDAEVAPTRTASRNARTSRSSTKRNAAKPTRNNKTSRSTTRERDAKLTRTNKKAKAKEFNTLEIIFELEPDRETKNKFVFIELDDSGDRVEGFGKGVIGQVYIAKTEMGTPPDRIKMTIEED